MSNGGPAGAADLGLIGCGLVGRHFGSRAARAGIRLVVHDSSRDKAARLLADGAVWADTPAEVAHGANPVVLCLPSPDASHSAIFGPNGLLEGASARTVVVETSTVGPAAVRRMADQLAGHSVELIDAALSRAGGDAASPQITLYVGCRPRTYPAIRPVLSALADTLLYCGPVGCGQVAKLVNNLVTQTHIVLLGEALAVGVKAGLPLETLTAALAAGTGQSRACDLLLAESVFRGDFRPGLKLAHARKDLRLANELARELGVPLDASADAIALYDRAEGEGWGQETAHAVLRLIEARAGVSLRLAPYRDDGSGSEPPGPAR